jgi:predicted RNA binding protein YcfA (HicA-like mRNA interferase family)
LSPRASLIAALGEAGVLRHHVRDSHHFLKHPAEPDIRVTIAYHGKALKRDTLRAILRQAHLTVAELRDNL